MKGKTAVLHSNLNLKERVLILNRKTHTQIFEALASASGETQPSAATYWRHVNHISRFAGWTVSGILFLRTDVSPEMSEVAATAALTLRKTADWKMGDSGMNIF